MYTLVSLKLAAFLDLAKFTIDKYKQLVSDQYQEPVEGKFPDATQQVLEAIKSPSDEELDYSSGSNTSQSRIFQFF